MSISAIAFSQTGSERRACAGRDTDVGGTSEISRSEVSSLEVSVSGGHHWQTSVGGRHCAMRASRCYFTEKTALRQQLPVLR